MAVKHGPCLLTLKKSIQAFEIKCLRKLLHISYLEPKTTDWVWSTINFLVESTGTSSGNYQEMETCMVWAHAMTASPKPSFRAPWRVGNAVVSRGNAGWTTAKSGHLCLCQNCSQGSLQKRLEKDLCWIIPHVPLMTQSIRDWTELELVYHHKMHGLIPHNFTFSARPSNSPALTLGNAFLFSSTAASP